MWRAALTSTELFRNGKTNLVLRERPIKNYLTLTLDLLGMLILMFAVLGLYSLS